MWTPRTLLVSWRWNDLADATASPHHICPVSDATNARLVRMHQKLGKEGIVHWINEDCIQNPNAAETEYIILLHGSGFAEEDAEHIKASLADASFRGHIHYFGSGKGFIYFTPSTDTGFIDHEGNFADKFDKDIRIRDEQGGLFHHYFHKVWRHYRYGAKRQLDNERTHLIRFLNPFIEGRGLHGTAVELMRQHRPESLVEVENLLNLLRENYADEIEVQEQLEALARLLSEKHLSCGGDLVTINEQFDELLAAIKEHDY